MRAKKVGVFTDATVAQLEPMKVVSTATLLELVVGLSRELTFFPPFCSQVIASLEENGVDYEVFDRCRVEPTDAS